MRRLFWGLIEMLVLAAAVVLAVLSPDIISSVLAILMTVIVAVSIWIGFIPLGGYMEAFRTAKNSIHRALDVKSDAPWTAVREMDVFFGHRELDRLFKEYGENVEQQRKFGVVLSDISEVVNEDMMYIRSWQGVMQQIPGTLTGLGILGTFIGLILGLRNIQFVDMTTAITSIQTLLTGISAAFYTSIVGVILSILVNIVNRTVWNIALREMHMFTEEFYRYIIPSEDEQARMRQRMSLQEILNRMDRMPSKGDFGRLGSELEGSDEQFGEASLLAQIQSALKNEEFTFHLQPIFDLGSRRIVGAEALVRWQHPKMGIIAPSFFMQTIEKNGYITKLDSVIWEQVCRTIRRWIDSGMAVVPITVNVSKTDILAVDVAKFFGEMIAKYSIPPMYLEIDIAENAYLQTRSAAAETEKMLRQMGIRVAVDGFDGNFVTYNSIEDISPDIVKLDMGAAKENKVSVASVFQQAAKLKLSMAAVGIESMEMMTDLRRSGCDRGQGYYLAKPISIANFEAEINRE